MLDLLSEYLDATAGELVTVHVTDDVFGGVIGGSGGIGAIGAAVVEDDSPLPDGLGDGTCSAPGYHG